MNIIRNTILPVLFLFILLNLNAVAQMPDNLSEDIAVILRESRDIRKNQIVIVADSSDVVKAKYFVLCPEIFCSQCVANIFKMKKHIPNASFDVIMELHSADVAAKRNIITALHSRFDKDCKVFFIDSQITIKLKLFGDGNLPKILVLKNLHAEIVDYEDFLSAKK